MCGRILFKHPREEVIGLFDDLDAEDIKSNFPPRYNIAPTQNLFIVEGSSGRPRLKSASWWLIPHWAQEKSKYPTFNARSEEAHNKPSFRDAYRYGRCIIPVSGYYEWQRKGAPFLVTLPDDQLMTLAGLWAYNARLDITSCTILTAPASENLSDLHHRMPLALAQDHHSAWLDPKTSVDEARSLLTRNRDAEFTFAPAHPDVGNVRNEGAYLMSAPQTLL